MVDSYDKILEVGESFFSVRDANTLLRLILKYAKEICQAERSTIFLKEIDPKSNEEILRSYMATAIGGELSEITVSTKIGIAGLTYKTGQAQMVKDVEKSSWFNPKIDEQTHFKTKSIISVPLIDNQRNLAGVLQVLNKLEGDFSENDIRKSKLLSLLAMQALSRIKDHNQIARMKKRLSEAHEQDLDAISFKTSHPDLRTIYEKAQTVAKSKSSVLLTGQSGTGKEVMARYIHNNSDRKDGPFVVVNCAAIPPTLFEAELFGIKSGVATDVSEREGVFQKANGGTLFLDEIGELPYEMQSKLLRVLQEKKVSKVGESEERFVDIRLVSATNRNLTEEIKKENGFREDLFFRINVFQFKLPSLAERIEDIDFLAENLLQRICHEQNTAVKGLSTEALLKLKSYSWPGNIRELKNVLERACVLTTKEEVIPPDLILIPEVSSEVLSITPRESANHLSEIVEMSQITRQFQKTYAEKVIEHFEGNKTKAAKSLKLSREGLRKILNRKVA